MKVYIAFIVAFLISSILLYGFLYLKDKNKLQILGSSIEINPTSAPVTPTEVQVPTTLPTPEPTVEPTLVPTGIITPVPTVNPQPNFTSEQINGFIERFASQYGVDPNVLRHVAVCESGFNQSSINGPYAGLYQFSKNSWNNNRLLMGENADPDLRFNAEESVQTAAYIISIGKQSMWPNCFP